MTILDLLSFDYLDFQWYIKNMCMGEDYTILWVWNEDFFLGG